jgi:anaerobic selenocysteine-containing dehydrogenase
MSTKKPETSAVGIPAIVSSTKLALAEMGPVRATKTLTKVNHTDGFDCPSCAWPDPDPGHRKLAEFCENGARAVAWEATRKRVDRTFFAQHSIAELRQQSDHWLESNGRLAEPMYLRQGAAHYEPITWDEALDLITARLKQTEPDRAVFYTSGRASNEAAFGDLRLARRDRPLLTSGVWQGSALPILVRE